MDTLSPSDLVGAQLRITLRDCRQLTGILLALDNKPNLLLNDTTESTPTSPRLARSSRQATTSRGLGLVSVPRDTIASVEIEASDLEKTVAWRASVV